MKLAALYFVLLVLAVLLGFSYARYRRDIRLARERVERGSGIVQTPCGSIEYASVGGGC